MKKNTPQLWDELWKDNSSNEQNCLKLEREERSIRWQRIEKTVLREFGSFKDLRVIEIGAGIGNNSALMAKKGALVSVLDDSGSPTPVERVLIRPPESRIGPLNDKERNEIVGRSPLKGRYDDDIDRESAFELLKARAEEESRVATAKAAELATEKAQQKAAKQTQRSSRPRGRPRQSMGEALMKSVLRSVGSSIGRKIARGIMGSLLGGK